MSTWTNDQLGVSLRRRSALACGRAPESRPSPTSTTRDSAAAIASELERIAASVEQLYGSAPGSELPVHDALHSLHRAIVAIREADGAAPAPTNAEHWIG
jgi:hypothetical protein